MLVKCKLLRNKIKQFGKTYHQYKMLTIPTNNKGMMDSVPLYSSILSIINIEIIEVNAMVIYNFQKSILVKINVLYALLLDG